MRPFLKITLQLLVSIGLAAVLCWYTFREINFEKLLSQVREADFLFIIISFLFLTISHISRSLRWSILYRPLGYSPGLVSTFLALMSGYSANMLLPRFGEAVRCWVLQRTEKIPFPVSIGSVVAERLVDLIMLIILFVIAFIIEFKRLNLFFIGIVKDKLTFFNSSGSFFLTLLPVFIAITVAIYFLYSKYKAHFQDKKIVRQFSEILKKIGEGVLSIGRIKEKKAFFIHTIIIWAMYFFASYIVTQALPQTSGLSMAAGFSILVVGSLGMAAPVQGGIGAFHLMVSSVLILYGLSKQDGLSFAFIVHTTQGLFTLVTGIVCFLISFVLPKSNSKIINDNGKKNPRPITTPSTS